MIKRIRIAVVLYSLFAVSSASASTRNWDGDTSVTWATAGNWDTAPDNSLVTDIANFNLATYGGNPVFAPTVGTATSINGLTIGAGNGAMTLTHTAALSIGDGGITIANGAGAFTISGSTTLGASQSWLNNSANLFTFGAVANGAYLLTIGGSGNTTASGVIGNGTGALTKEGGGILTLSGANTYTGTTTINGGTLMFSGSGTTPNANTISVNSSGVLTFGRNDTWGNDGTATSAAITVNSSGTLASGGYFNTLWNPTFNGGSVLLNGGVSANWPAFQFAGTLTAAGTVSVTVGSGSFNFINIGGTGNGVLTVNTPNATDQLTVNARLQTNQKTTGALTKNGTGTLTLSAANTYTGTTTVNGGELRWGIDNAIAGGALNINNGGTVNIQTFSDTVGAITINKGGTLTGGTGLYTHAGTFTLADGGTVNGFNGTTSGFLNLGADLSYTSSGASSVMATINRLGAGAATRTLTIARGGDSSGVDLDITEVLMGNGAFNLVKAGAGVLRLSGSTASSGRSTGTTTINDGTVLLNKSASVEAIGGSGTITIGDNTGTAGSAILQHATGSADNQILNNAVTINGDGLWDLNGHNETTSGTLTINRNGQVDLNGGNLSAGALAIVATSGSGNTTPIKNTAGSGSLTMTTLGITPLAGTTSTISLNGATATLGGNVTFTAGGNGQAQVNGNVGLGAATKTFTIASGGSAYDLDINGVISNGGVTTAGAGKLQFSGSGSNTYGTITTTGGTGSLLLNKSGTANAIGAGGLSVGTGTIVKYIGNSTDMIADTAPVTITGTGRLDFNGVNDTIGNVTITATTAGATTPLLSTAGAANVTIGTLGITAFAGNLSQISLNGGTLTLGGDVTFNNATTGQAQIGGNLDLSGATRTFTIGFGTGANQDLLIDAVISGTSVGLTKAGTGRLALTGVNAYTGATTVNAGTLLVNSPGLLASGSAVTVAAGATLGGNGTINGTVAVNSSGTLVGTITIGGAVTAAASGIISPAGSGAAGTLNLANAGNALTLNGSALLFDVLSNDGSSRDQMAITGNLVLNGATTLFINAPAGIAAGNYTLMTFAATTGSGSIVFPNGSTTMGNLTVTVNATDVTLSAGVGGETGDVWSGAASYVWDGGALNWTKNGAASLAFADGDAVTFDDTGAAVSTITSVGTVSPGSVLFNNSSKNYTVSATIGGTGTPVVKNGSGTVTLSTPTAANTYTGGTTINAGTVQGTTTSTSLTPPNPLSTGAITLNGSGTILQLRASGTLNTTAETIQFNNNVTVGGDATINIDRPGATSTTKTIQLGTLSIGANTLGVTGGNTYDLRINGATTLTGNATFNPTTANLTLASAVGDGSADYSLTKTGAGTLILSGANTFSGGIFINAGVLQINSADNLGNSANLVTFTGNGTLQFTSNTTLSQGFAINEGATGTLWCYKLTIIMTNPLAGSGTLNIQTQGDGYGGLFEFTNTNNTFSGNISIYNWSGGSYAAELRMNSLDDTPGRRIKLGTGNATAAFTYGAGAVVPLVLSNRQIELNASNGILNNNATDVNCTVTVNTDLIVTGGSRPFILGGSNSGNNTFAGAITNVTNLTKAGAGKWILSGTNTYTGTTTVSAGTLLVNAPGSLAADSAVTVASAATLGGNGTINGTVSVSAGGSLAPGSGNTIGTLTLANNSASSLALNGNTLLFDLPASGTTCDLIAISGALGGLALNGANYITLSAPSGAQTGTYTLMTYSTKTGSGTLTFPNGSTTMTVGSSTFTLTVGATSVTLIISDANVGSLNSDIWSGAASYVWDGGALNWTKNSTPSQAFADGDRVTFDDGGANGAAITSGGTVSPASIHFNNSNKSYTVSAAIGGAGSLFKSGAGQLTLSGGNTYTGGTVLSAGTLVTTADANLGSGGGITVNGAASWNWGNSVNYARALTVNEGAVLTLNQNGSNTGVLSGNGTITVSGAVGPVFSNSGSTFTGTVNPGYGLSIANLGDSSNPIVLGNFTWTGSAKTFALRPVISSTASGYGYSINNSGTGALTIQQNLTFAGAGSRTLTLGGSYGTTANQFAGNIGDNGASAVSITKSGDNSIWALGGTSTYSGTTSLGTGGNPNNGYLIFQGVQALSPSTALTLAQNNANAAPGYFKILDDSATPASRATVNMNYSCDQNTASDQRGYMTLFVGNNNTANGGTSSSTQTGSTIQLGDFNISQPSLNNVGGAGLALTGANSYRLQIANVKVTLFNGFAASWYVKLNPTTAPLTVTGNVQQQAGVTGANVNLQLDGTATGSLISGIIKDSADGTARALSLTKQNTSVWTLTGVNTYTGTTTISAGLLRVNSPGSLASGSAVTVSGGALGGTGTANGSVTLTTAGGIDLRDGAVATTFTIGGGLAINGAAGANNLYFDVNGSTVVDKINVTGNVTMATPGAGVIVLNTLSGTIADGTYDLIVATGTMPAATSFTTASGFGKTFALQLDGTGKILQLVVTSGAPTGPAAAFWSGASSVNWSTIGNWNTSVAGGVGAGSAPGYQANVTFYTTTPAAGNLATGVLDADFDINSLNFLSTATTAVTIGGPSRTLTIEAGTANGNTAGNGITINTPSSGTPTHTISAKVGLASSQTWTVNSGAALTVSGVVSDFGVGYRLTKSGTGVLTLSANNTFSGGLTVNAGTVRLSGAQNIGGGVILNGGALGDNTVNLTAAGLNGNTITVNGNASIGAQLGASYVASSTITLNSGNLTIANNNGGTSWAGAVTGAGGLVVGQLGSGANTINLNSTANNFTGGVDYNNGVNGTAALVVNSFADSLSPGTGNIRFGVAAGATATQSFTLDTGANLPLIIGNRRFEIISNTGASTTGFQINNNSGQAFAINSDLLTTSGAGNTRTLTLGGTGAGVSTFAGIIANGSLTTLNVTKANSGNWSLSNPNNTFTGTITLSSTTTSAGTLAYASAGGANPITFSTTTGSATLSYIGAAPLTISGVITASALTTGTITLDASGVTAADTINYSNTGSLGSAGSGNKNLILSGSNTGANTLAGVWANNTGGAATLTKNGAGTWVLSGANTYTGATTLNAGTLLVNGSIAAGSAVNFVAGTLGGTGTISGAVSVPAAGNVSPGSNGIGTLNIGGGLDISALAGGAGKLLFDIAAAEGTSDRIAVTGGLSIGNGALGLGDFDFTSIGGQPAGAYTLITTTTGITGSLDGADSSGAAGSLGSVRLVIEGNNLVLMVSSPVGTVYTIR
jgi:autotransporter-associated beta strand protein